MAFDIINVFFKGREETLKIFGANESIVKLLSDVDNPICPLLGKEITFVKMLGEGKGGVVFEISYPDQGNRRYVAKISRIPEQLFAIYNPKRGLTLRELQNEYQISMAAIISYNNLDPNTDPDEEVTRIIVIPLFKKGCILRRSVKIPRVDGKGFTIFNSGDYICEGVYTEFMIALLVGELYRAGQSINFLDTFYFATCLNNSITDVNQYTFMEKIDRSLRKTIGCITEINYKGYHNPVHVKETVNTIMVQIIHAIGVYQEKYQIVHGDLHDDNVFLEFVTPELIWKARSVLNADYYHYRVKEQDIYVPGGRVCPFIVKIGDWGLACKYSTPKIAEDETIKTGMDQLDGNGPYIPNFYTTAYDVYFITNIMYRLNPTNEFIQSIMAWMLQLEPGYTKSMIDAAVKKITSGTGRLTMKSLTTTLSHVNPADILTNKTIMGTYLDRPVDDEEIIQMGEF